MKITDKRGTGKVAFGDIEEGQGFISASNLWIRTPSREGINAYRPVNGGLVKFEADELVTPVDVEIIIRDRSEK